MAAAKFLIAGARRDPENETEAMRKDFVANASHELSTR